MLENNANFYRKRIKSLEDELYRLLEENEIECTSMMKTGHRPQQPKCPLGAIQPLPMDTEGIKQAAWLKDGILIISRHDVRLGWDDALLVKNLGDRLYGKGN